MSEQRGRGAEGQRRTNFFFSPAPLLLCSSAFILVWPKLRGWKNSLKKSSVGDRIKLLFAFSITILFWVGTFLVFCRVLRYFQEFPQLGDVLAQRLMSMIFLTFFSILIFSNIISSLTIFFLSEDLNLLISVPLSLGKVYFSRYIETFLTSSWMVILFGLPVFLAYGIVYKAGLLYYLIIPFVTMPFFMIASSLGILMAIILVNIFPARQIKEIFILLSILLGVMLYLFIRFLKPERLFNPEEFSTVAQFLAQMNAPTSPMLPSHWAKEALFPLVMKIWKDSLFFLSLLISTGFASMVLVNYLFLLLYLRGFSKAQEARKVKLSKISLFDHFLMLLTHPFGHELRAMVIKDVKSFFRDTSQWSQVFLLLALIVVYLYNFSVLPIDKIGFPTFYLENLISFLNLGLAGFVLSSISVRFIFPSISIEGNNLWILKSSPMLIKNLVMGKFLTGLIPLLILAEILIISSNLLLNVTNFMMVLSACTVFLLTFGITSLGVGLGSIFPQFKADNPVQMATSFGGLLYMILSMVFIGFTVILEAWPVYLIFMSHITGRVLDFHQWIGISLSFVLVIVLNLVTAYYPLRMGIRKLEDLEVVF